MSDVPFPRSPPPAEALPRRQQRGHRQSAPSTGDRTPTAVAPQQHGQPAGGAGAGVERGTSPDPSWSISLPTPPNNIGTVSSVDSLSYPTVTTTPPVVTTGGILRGTSFHRQVTPQRQQDQQGDIPPPHLPARAHVIPLLSLTTGALNAEGADPVDTPTVLSRANSTGTTTPVNTKKSSPWLQRAPSGFGVASASPRLGFSGNLELHPLWSMPQALLRQSSVHQDVASTVGLPVPPAAVVQREQSYSNNSESTSSSLQQTPVDASVAILTVPQDNNVREALPTLPLSPPRQSSPDPVPQHQQPLVAKLVEPTHPATPTRVVSPVQQTTNEDHHRHGPASMHQPSPTKSISTPSSAQQSPSKAVSPQRQSRSGSGQSAYATPFTDALRLHTARSTSLTTAEERPPTPQASSKAEQSEVVVQPPQYVPHQLQEPTKQSSPTRRINSPTTAQPVLASNDAASTTRAGSSPPHTAPPTPLPIIEVHPSTPTADETIVMATDDISNKTEQRNINNDTPQVAMATEMESTATEQEKSPQQLKQLEEPPVLCKFDQLPPPRDDREAVGAVRGEEEAVTSPLSANSPYDVAAATVEPIPGGCQQPLAVVPTQATRRAEDPSSQRAAFHQTTAVDAPFVEVTFVIPDHTEVSYVASTPSMTISQAGSPIGMSCSPAARPSTSRLESISANDASSITEQLFCHLCGMSTDSTQELRYHWLLCEEKLDQLMETLVAHPLCSVLAYPTHPMKGAIERLELDEGAALHTDEGRRAFNSASAAIFTDKLCWCRGCGTGHTLQSVLHHIQYSCPRHLKTSSQCTLVIEHLLTPGERDQEALKEQEWMLGQVTEETHKRLLLGEFNWGDRHGVVHVRPRSHSKSTALGASSTTPSRQRQPSNSYRRSSSPQGWRR
ncbi:Hypothetical protein, putative [Bodo saltans]|uniref:Uncharacterized protein n=1 Tax=Bodo saltans TaxID=75058 RepID=A0A0S4JP92_BODSA|nr:Hypothetical protein, putative [Bodo saltans]|eukprot:CUG91748.1 Hypothetical protein, putative [Bodo saltans]